MTHLDLKGARSWGLWGLFAAWLFAAVPGGASAQTLTTLLTNGPTANRINVVVLSEGYTEGQLAKFLVDATNAVNRLLEAPPYQEYRNYFNGFAIFVASAQSGSDHYTPATNLVDTYFNSTFDSYGEQRVLTIPPNDRDPVYAHGQGKVDALLQSLLPEYDFVVMLVNDPQYGASGGSVVISSLNASLPELVRHESGHTFGGLADEYTTAYDVWVPYETPNTTQQTNRALIKWTVWINGGTPVPTPATLQYSSVIGLFEGAQYQKTGWYRPKLDCKMNHLGVAFCAVCSEQLVKATSQIVNPIDSFTPPGLDVSITSTQAVTFSVQPLQPATHPLAIQWFTNNVPVTHATNFLFTLQPRFFANGFHTVRAEIRDLTPLVRSDPDNVLSNSVAWTVAVSVTQLGLASPLWLPEGRFACTVTGTAPRGFVLETSPDLAQWTPLLTNTLTGGKFYFTNAAAGGMSRRFYRAAGQ